MREPAAAAERPTPSEIREAERVRALPRAAQSHHPSAVAADPLRLRHINTYGELPEVYLDLPFVCRDCGAPQIWRAVDQKWYYEEAKGHIDSTAVRCRECRRKRREGT